MARWRRDSRATSETSSISAPARSIVAGCAEEAGHGRARLHDVEQWRPVDQHVVDRGHLGVVVDAEGGAGIALRVEIDDEDLQAGLRHGGRHVDGGRRLADSALLVRDRQHPRDCRLGERPAGQLDPASGAVGEVAGQRGVISCRGDGGRNGVALPRSGRLDRHVGDLCTPLVHSVVPRPRPGRFHAQGPLSPSVLSTALSTGVDGVLNSAWRRRRRGLGLRLDLSRVVIRRWRCVDEGVATGCIRGVAVIRFT